VEPGVAPTDAVTRGQLHPSKINPVLEARQSAFFDCYEAALERDSALRGKVTLVIVIAPEGTVPHAEVSASGTTVDNAGLFTCLTSEAMKLRFERPRGGRVVTQYTLDFNPPEAEQKPE
jgi:hypothetical protein